MENNISDTMDFVIERFKVVEQANMQIEVIVAALDAMKTNPSLTIEEAFEAGCEEWDV
ncbi:MAG TPA: hypothetical protein PK431_10765 [Chitinophagales bacterium]|nr:hypothetical protein [Chitinophagales bacterium]